MPVAADAVEVQIRFRKSLQERCERHVRETCQVTGQEAHRYEAASANIAASYLAVNQGVVHPYASCFQTRSGLGDLPFDHGPPLRQVLQLLLDRLNRHGGDYN